jgi:hypothetical protein
VSDEAKIGDFFWNLMRGLMWEQQLNLSDVNFSFICLQKKEKNNQTNFTNTDCVRRDYRHTDKSGGKIVAAQKKIAIKKRTRVPRCSDIIIGATAGGSSGGIETAVAGTATIRQRKGI